MRKLYLGNGDKQFKFADTTTEIHLNAFDDGSAANLANDAKVRIKNDSGYLLGVSASITDNHAVITSGQLVQLPVGSYLIELWNTVDGGIAIYPSDGFLALQINENVTGLSGGLVSSITVDDFIKQFSSLSEQLKQEVAVAIANGLKGDKGDDGLSAYQIAVINGYQGSQTEWLTSLVGDKGDKGDTGAAGKDFKIVKTFPSIAEMNGDGFSDGDFTMIASDVNDPDDGKLYVWNGTSFTYVADLSGSQGIKGDKGDKGDKGEKGDTGDQGLSAYQIAVNAGFSGSVDQWLESLVGPKGDKGDTGDTGPIGPVGAGLTVKGSVNDASQLPTTGNQEGYCYFVGTDLYIWDAGAWKNYGKVVNNAITKLNSTDMDNVLTSGYYQLIGGTNGIPSGDNWTIYQVITLTSQNGVQLAYGTNKTVLGLRSWNYTGGKLNWASWVQLADDSKVLHLSTSNTASRPTGISTGYQHFDTSLNKPIWYTGKNWVDATGTTV